MERGAGGWMEVRVRLVDGGVREAGVGRLACGLSCVWAVVNTVSWVTEQITPGGLGVRARWA